MEPKTTNLIRVRITVLKAFLKQPITAAFLPGVNEATALSLMVFLVTILDAVLTLFYLAYINK